MNSIGFNRERIDQLAYQFGLEEDRSYKKKIGFNDFWTFVALAQELADKLDQKSPSPYKFIIN